MMNALFHLREELFIKLCLFMGQVISAKQKTESVIDTVKAEFQLSRSDLTRIGEHFKNEMEKGWEAGHGSGAPADKSSLKMLTSHINVLPTSDECGAFFAVDLGGTNLRVLRVTLKDGKSTVAEYREAIPPEVMSSKATADDLFNFIASACGELCKNHLCPAGERMPLGFTFSFPLSQSSIKSGKLIEWTKGFETRGCVGEDPAGQLQAALDRKGVPLSVEALCNDTVGTLMTNAFRRGGSRDCRIGVILGTGTNAAYVEPSAGGLIVNIEWGGFTGVPQTQFDRLVDKESINPGRQFLEKIVSGLYLGEIARLATVHALTLGGRTVPDRLSVPHSIDTAIIFSLLAGGDSLDGVDPESLAVLSTMGDAVIERSAAVAGAVLAAVVDRTCEARCQVGIDGSVFTKGHRYQERLMHYVQLFHPEGVTLHVSEDGSGLGAALVAAAVSHGKQVEK
jgi:hexokinase